MRNKPLLEKEKPPSHSSRGGKQKSTIHNQQVIGGEKGPNRPEERRRPLFVAIQGGRRT